MADTISILSLIVSVVAIVVTVRSTRYSERLSEREIQLVRYQLDQAQREVNESKTASISARMYAVDRSNHRVKIFNTGPSEARNVRVVLDEQNSIVSDGALSRLFPMDRMEKGQGVDVIAYVHMQSPAKEYLRLRWDDPSGIDRENRVEITR